jgi:hypothetical protein
MERHATRYEVQETITIPLQGQGSPEARPVDEAVEAILAEAQRIGELTREEAERVRRILVA